MGAGESGGACRVGEGTGNCSPRREGWGGSVGEGKEEEATEAGGDGVAGGRAGGGLWSPDLALPGYPPPGDSAPH